ncbi:MULTISPECIES: MmcQ/YjbR family DNA-binding protein [Alteromonadaceae]|uniref:MmcQ/YjbR family DNA-binding protein n=1 Tax=Brumicola blandensis TaxID=3075611 RepID=A0AAW8R4X7_9ALTE|nr:MULTISPECIES: MmcQ/YjbR family DNA-binding protein [unclassified Alteromonas]MDT0582223.1 MmcQ/YjbR family DNA-binding protein [Alteromonas sp. W409]MDT0627821.1 MmcQ/YjbR family DNA-binding protein [Alteromonas sp. W364]
MTHDEFNAFCRAKAHTTYVVQWGGSHVWKVAGKLFALGTTNKEGGPAYTFKTSEMNYHFLSQAPGYKPAPYMASRGMLWIQQHQSPAENDEELRYYLNESYRLVTLGFSKKKQRELGFNQI